MSVLSFLQEAAANILDGVAQQGERATRVASQRGASSGQMDEVTYRASEARDKACELREQAKEEKKRAAAERIRIENELDDACSRADVANQSGNVSKSSLPDSRKDDFTPSLIYMLSQQLRIEEKDISLESSIVGDLCTDDMDDIEILLAKTEISIGIEKFFEIKASYDDVEGFVTVQDVLDYLLKNTPKK